MWNFSFSLRSFILPLFLSLTTLSGCFGQRAENTIEFEKMEIAIEGSSGRISIMAEIARTDEQRERGLMFREEVKDGEGMLFIFEQDMILSFWMKNTLVPLSIAYIAHNGTIIEIFDMEPGDLNPVRSSRSVRYALEVPQNWFNRVGLGPGDRLDTLGLP